MALLLLAGGDALTGHGYLGGSDWLVMRGAIGLFLASGLSIGTVVEAAPAWMLIRADVGSGPPIGRSLVIKEFPSMASCEAIATHIHSLRGIPPEENGLRGIWRSNWKANKSEPLVVTLCIPDVSEIEAVAEPLKAADRYRLFLD